jgi:hypothetical protein
MLGIMQKVIISLASGLGHRFVLPVPAKGGCLSILVCH